MTILQIVAAVAQERGLSLAEVLAHNRMHRVSLVRHEAMYRAASETEYPLSHIGRRMKRDRATVRWGVHQHASRHGLPVPRRAA